MKEFVVGLDGSEESGLALRWAMAVAMAFAIGLPSLRGSFPSGRRPGLAYGADIGL